jgi:hypothetical protein
MQVLIPLPSRVGNFSKHRLEPGAMIWVSFDFPYESNDRLVNETIDLTTEFHNLLVTKFMFVKGIYNLQSYVSCRNELS